MRETKLCKNTYVQIFFFLFFFSAQGSEHWAQAQIFTFLCGSPLGTEQMEDLIIKIEYDWKLHQWLCSPWHSSDP